MIDALALMQHVTVAPAADDGYVDGYGDNAVEYDTSKYSRGKRRLLQYAGIGGGAVFVLIPNSELIHGAFRAVAGASVGYQCC